jgi:hypothetical protein
MNPLSELSNRVEATQLRRGEVVDVTESGTLIVAFEHDVSPPVRCDLLITSDAAPAVFVPGDGALVWIPSDGAPAVVIGRIGPSRGLTPAPGDTPDTLTIEARESLTLRVGDGCITMRADGKILITGKDLVSHAQRTNRIKGGAVAIN